MKAREMKEMIGTGGLDHKLVRLYGRESLSVQRDRYLAALDSFSALYGADRQVHLFSVPGRSELSGNHTDHNHGCVIAASIDLDVIAVASLSDTPLVRLKSEGYGEDRVDLIDYSTPLSERYGSSASLIAGVCAGFAKRGYATGGFDAYTTSNVLKGSGLSSSAAFEDMIGTVLSHLYNGGEVDTVEIAKISKEAENLFFGKPCGLMDQVACAEGGMVAIDFELPEEPRIRRISLDLTEKGYRLCIVNTGGNHADLTDDYASVPSEMKSVAAALGKEVLRQADYGELIAAIPSLRERLGDRALLRAMHFYQENRRVDRQREALEAGDVETFLCEVKASGRSSFCYLQNVYTVKNPAEQGLSLALCLAEEYLSDRGGAWRVHGGGFAGTVQAFVPEKECEGFCRWMDRVFGEGSCIVLRVRPEGALCLV